MTTASMTLSDLRLNATLPTTGPHGDANEAAPEPRLHDVTHVHEGTKYHPHVNDLNHPLNGGRRQHTNHTMPTTTHTTTCHANDQAPHQ